MKHANELSGYLIVRRPFVIAPGVGGQLQGKVAMLFGEEAEGRDVIEGDIAARFERCAA